MMNPYQHKQSNKQAKLLELHPQWFNNDKGGGVFRGNSYPFILTNPINNLFEGFRDDALFYMKENHIKWHTQWGNMKSSQVACFNHLFGIRNCQKLILEMLNTAQNITTFQRVLPIPYEADETYIAFEVVSKGDWLGEGIPTRGSNCTSIDAFILAEDFEAKRWLIPIEWKYTEAYACEDKSIEGKGQERFGGSYKGKTRLNRYSHLIEQSKFLHSVQEYEGSIYYQEPFYQLMRQTLWAEQIMNKSICEEELSAQRMMHIHIVPEENIFLILPSQYRKESISAHWQKQLKHPELYICISPKRFMYSILSKLNGNLGEYLQCRYWD